MVGEHVTRLQTLQQPQGRKQDDSLHQEVNRKETWGFTSTETIKAN